MFEAKQIETGHTFRSPSVLLEVAFISVCWIGALAVCHRFENSKPDVEIVNPGQNSPNKLKATLSEAQAKTFLQGHRRIRRNVHAECQKGCFFTELNEVGGVFDLELKREFMVRFKCSTIGCNGHCIITNANYFHIDNLGVICIVDGSWGSWGSWGTCSVTCGGGVRTRVRSCDNPAPQNGGSYCHGSNNEGSSCGDIPCPVDGMWGSWNSWGDCSVTCELGVMYRTRSCNDPAPDHGGLSCIGTNISSATCQLPFCPVDGAWSSWRTWSACAVVNNGVLRSRCRKCTNPIPQYGGAFCPYNSLESEKCPISPDTFKPKCRCRRARMPVIKNISTSELVAIVDELKEELTVDKTQTSIAVRKKISAPDSRKSSAVIGALLGGVMFTIPMLFICTVDLVNVYQYFTGRNRVWPSPRGQLQHNNTS